MMYLKTYVVVFTAAFFYQTFAKARHHANAVVKDSRNKAGHIVYPRCPFHFGVVALQQKPFVHPDGSGFVADLLEKIAATWGIEGCRARIIPVATWDELKLKVETEEFDLAFIPHVVGDNPDWLHGVGLTKPVMLAPPVAVLNKQAMSPFHGTLAVQKDLASISLEYIAVRGSPWISLFGNEINSKKLNDIHLVDTFEEGINLLKRLENGALLTEEATAESEINNDPCHLAMMSVMANGGHPNMAMFKFAARDLYLNEVVTLGLMEIHENGELHRLKNHYFPDVNEC